MVSVVIRAKNEEKHIGYCLQSITDYIGKPQIIIVDNESTDDTIPIVNRFEYHDVEKISISKNEYSPGKALNLGVQRCIEEYVIIIRIFSVGLFAPFWGYIKKREAYVGYM